ncbi:MAG: RidA family protein [Rhodospirillales bacterium]|jgi:enamine deaminase RidA (YjgF/YER057c/UK114 family)|nr:RidA family protein [Rhodospirillales bacterium]MDP6803743.1 RidA family protein [Rhodospirillales bacterium]
MSETGERRWVGTGTHWEEIGGYARAVRIGERILVSGTTATGPDGVVGAGDAATQARFILGRIEKAINDLGGRMTDVVRTRVYVSDIAHWEAVARVHGETFAPIRPANTLVEARLAAPEHLVEIEAEAVVGAGDALQP